MKHLTAIAFALLLTSQIQAQSFQNSSLESYITDASEAQSPAWWRALDAQLVLMLDAEPQAVSAAALRNAIYFASLHPERVSLEGAVPALVRIYDEHPDLRFRMMAVAALHALDQTEALTGRFEFEQSERLRNMTIAALLDRGAAQ